MSVEIKLTISDEQIKKAVKYIKKLNPDIKEVLDVKALFTQLFQQDCDELDMYIEYVCDGGGNALVGDVLERSNVEGVLIVEEWEDEEE